ncbi:transposase [Sphaerisporangium sp. NPDC051017]|uniref:RNA-guided endonuclease InsQ/TnpB family protein n=1 Tax=Sphaerisporangium sp. NPDC051017 TaxID=3154636 RepID=UPI00342942DA
MRLVVQVKLLPTTEQAAVLEATLDAANRAADLVSRIAFTQRCFRNFDLRRHAYDRIKAEFGLAAQAAQHVIKKVADAYRTLHANLAAGNLGKPGSARWVKAGSKPITFRAGAAQPFDDRCLSWQLQARTVLIWTVAGRLRRRLQAKRTKSAKRLLKRRARKEARFAANVNHVIAQKIVTEAERTCRGVALEDLQGIRERVRLRKPQRVTLHSWSFHQLGGFIGYKAARRGVAVIHVDPAYSSQQCSSCGHVDRKNRPDRETFRCTSCGFAEHADVNAARNIASRGVAGWAVSHAA